MVSPQGEGKSLVELSPCGEELTVTWELALRGSGHQLEVGKGPDTKLGCGGLALVAAWDAGLGSKRRRGWRGPRASDWVVLLLCEQGGIRCTGTTKPVGTVRFTESGGAEEWAGLAAHSLFPCRQPGQGGGGSWQSLGALWSSFHWTLGVLKPTWAPGHAHGRGSCCGFTACTKSPVPSSGPYRLGAHWTHWSHALLLGTPEGTTPAGSLIRSEELSCVQTTTSGSPSGNGCVCVCSSPTACPRSHSCPCHPGRRGWCPAWCHAGEGTQQVFSMAWQGGLSCCLQEGAAHPWPVGDHGLGKAGP